MLAYSASAPCLDKVIGYSANSYVERLAVRSYLIPQMIVQYLAANYYSQSDCRMEDITNGTIASDVYNLDDRYEYRALVG